MEEKNRRERLFEPAEARSSKSTENVCVCVRVFASSHFFFENDASADLSVVLLPRLEARSLFSLAPPERRRARRLFYRKEMC